MWASGLAFLCALVLPHSAARADIVVFSPSDGDLVTAAPCPNESCVGEFAWDLRVTGSAANTIEVNFLSVPPGFNNTVNICRPPDPVEPSGSGCPALPSPFSKVIPLGEGVWDARVRVIRGAAVEEFGPIRLTVRDPGLIPPGTITLESVVPNEGSPPIVLSTTEPDAGVDDASPFLVAEASEINIIGENLYENEFLEVFLAPKLIGEPALSSGSALPVDDWCRVEAEIIRRDPQSGGRSQLTVRMPDLPLEMPTVCGLTPGAPSSIFSKQGWRWVIRDKWIRPQRVHTWWAIPSQRQVPWLDAPAFKVVKTAYPDVDGFGFANQATKATYQEFLSVYRNNAYICVGLLGACATRIPDPLYHVMWLPIYLSVIDSSDGSCNGMSATSLLMANEHLQTEDFNPRILFPAGFIEPGDPTTLGVDEDDKEFTKFVPTFRDTNFCTPVCSPTAPVNLWAHIRRNHGVQMSREFLTELVQSYGESLLDEKALNRAPEIALERIRNAPSGYVLCFFGSGKGHCVVPYRVQNDRIWIYDNNNPGDESLYIDILDDGRRYQYPGRKKEPNSGRGMVAFPLSIWRNGVHLLGLRDFGPSFDGIEFLYSIVVGSADMIVTNDTGGRWGVEDDGSFTDELPGAVSIPPLGPSAEDVRQVPLLLAMNQAVPTITVTSDGGPYTVHSGQAGHLLQLETNHAQAGDKDEVRLGYDDEGLSSFDFIPERDANKIVPRVGLEIEEEESGVFQWLGLRVAAGGSVGFDADRAERAVGFRNDSGALTRHLLTLDYGSGSSGEGGRILYGPFEVPSGATHQIIAEDWPTVGTLISELDLDRDGNPETREIVEGREAPPQADLESEADVSLQRTAEPTMASASSEVVQTLIVENAGPDSATNLKLFDVISGSAEVALLQASQGDCAETDDGIDCTLGTLLPGEAASVTVRLIPIGSGELKSAGMVLGAERDSDLTNNSAVDSATASGPDGGCSCRLYGPNSQGQRNSVAFWLALLVAWSWMRRRRRRTETAG